MGMKRGFFYLAVEHRRRVSVRNDLVHLILQLRIRGGLVEVQLGSCLGAGVHYFRESLENDERKLNASEVTLEALDAW